MRCSLYACSLDQTISVYDVRKGGELERLLAVGHDSPIRCLKVIEPEPGVYALASGADDSSIRVWRLDDPANPVAWDAYSGPPIESVRGVKDITVAVTENHKHPIMLLATGVSDVACCSLCVPGNAASLHVLTPGAVFCVIRRMGPSPCLTLLKALPIWARFTTTPQKWATPASARRMLRNCILAARSS